MATLTDQQRHAVEARGGNVLVSAAAGSGKTMVLVERLMSYILDPVSPANIDDFLIITYTKAAAAELREKILKKINNLLAEDGRNRHLQNQLQRIYLAKISTVHGFCTEILRENAYRSDIPVDFRVAEEDECAQLQAAAMERLLEEMYDRIESDNDFLKVVDTQGFGRDDRKLTQVILSIYDSSRCHLDPDAWLSACVKESDLSGIEDAGQTLWGKYLINDLHSDVELHISALRRCADAASVSVGMEKAATLLYQTVAQLEILLQCHTWQEIHDHRLTSFGTMTFSKTVDGELKEQIKAVRDGCKESLTKKQAIFAYDNRQVLNELSSCTPVVRGLVDLVRRFSQQYDRLKQLHRVMDFSDLEQKTLDLLWGRKRTGISAVANELSLRFREVMVDEYQDSNAVQDAIFKALTNERKNCFMVGDVKQSIYQFRLADPGIFLEKYNSYLPAEAASINQGRKVLLTKNFRSAPDVIHSVNAVFSQCMSPRIGGLTYGEDEQLNGDETQIPVPEAQVEFYGIEVDTDTYGEEAAFIANRIRRMLDNRELVRDGDNLRPVVPEDIAIILRSPGSVGIRYAAALESVGIGCCYNGEQDVLQSEEIQFLRSLLQVLDNPLQDIPLIATMMSRVYGFTADDLVAIRTTDKYGPIYSVISKAMDDRTSRFYEQIGKLRALARTCTVSELVEHILVETRMDGIFYAINGNIDSIEAFLQLTAQAESTGRRDVRSFLSYLDGIEDRGLSAADSNRTKGKVTILSIHKSKGLEYPVVFLCGLSKVFNREDLKEQVLCDKTLGLGVTYVDTEKRLRYPTIAKRAIMVKKAADSLSEEMRVLYVAMTRAKDRLIMTYASRYLQKCIEKCARRLDFAGGELIASEVSSMGDWVLQTAMRRVESGELFQLGGRSNSVEVHNTVWKVSVISQQPAAVGTNNVPEESKVEFMQSDIERLKERLTFAYPYPSATTFPSKQTATQLKGRVKDFETQQDAPERKYYRAWRKPSFVEKEKDSLAAGTAMHKALQILTFSQVPSKEILAAELTQLRQQGRLTGEELSMVDQDALYRFYQTDIGKMCCSGANVLKEFKFSVLVDGGQFDPDIAGEQVLLQGVVDCAIIEEDGITVIDFKTDQVTETTVHKAAAEYNGQIKAYANALSKIYKLPIKRAALCFLRIGALVNVN